VAVKKSKAKKKVTTKSRTPVRSKVKKPSVVQQKVQTSLIPARDGVLIERLAEAERTPGGLIIPTTALEKPLTGIVVQAGKGKITKHGKLRPLDVQAGDKVLFGKFAGTEIKINGKEFLLIREDEILGVIS